jgi:hypothetical protein
LREIAAEARSFWSPGYVRLALAIVAGMLLLELVFAAAVYAGADGQFGRAPLAVQQVASFFGLNAGWARAIFRATETIEIPQYSIERSLRDPFGLTSNLLRDVAGITVTLLLPVFAALGFTTGADLPTGDAGPGRRLVFRSLITVGPLALLALTLTVASTTIHTVFASLPAADPSLYPIERLLLAPWGSVGQDLLVAGPWILVPFLLIPTVAAAWRDQQQSLAATLGTSLFLIPLIQIIAASLYPGGLETAPSFLFMYGDTLIKLALFVLVLPFALRTLRSEQSLA